MMGGKNRLPTVIHQMYDSNLMEILSITNISKGTLIYNNKYTWYTIYMTYKCHSKIKLFINEL